jgi:Zn finger protein HypA/HybF involved in hydrogenase expression
MGLVDPVKVYAATSNLQGQMIAHVLQSAGVEAFAGEDVSAAGMWIGGTLPGVFDAGVYVSRRDAERAVEIIRQHERVEAQRSSNQGPELETICEDCGKSATFPASKRGTVQNCPHCGAYIDVGEGETVSGSDVESEEEEDQDPLPE